MEGRSLVPLLKNPQAEWPSRILVTHVGRWPKGDQQDYKFATCSVRTPRWHLVCEGKKPTRTSFAKAELFDVEADPGEQHNVADRHADVVKQLSEAYDQWWNSIQPQLVNENVPLPAENAYKRLYQLQFGSK